MSPLILIAAVVASAGLSFVLTPFAGWVSQRTGAIDLPGPRKIHNVPIPRLGGLAVLIAIASTGLLLRGTGLVDRAELPSPFLLGLALGMAPVLLVSILDDARSMPVAVKFAAQGIGAAIAINYGFRLGDTVHILGWQTHIGLVAIPVSWLWIVGVTNAFNLADGLDGLSAGLALISASSLAVVALILVDAPQALLALMVVGALSGFLPFNTHPARIFFGDTGAACIGFVLACLGLWGTSRLSSGMVVIAPILVMGVPIADALVAVSRRTLRRIRRLGGGGVFAADQEHIHHRLLRKGFDHKRAVLLLYAIGLAIAVVGVLSLFLTSGRAAVVVVTLMLAAAVGIRQLEYEEFAIVSKGFALRMYDMPVLQTGTFRVFCDIAFAVLSIYIAFVLKFDKWHLTAERETAIDLLIIVVPVTVVTFVSFGLYRRSWRFITIEDLVLSTAATVTSSIAGFLLTPLTMVSPLPATYFVVYALVLTALVVAARSSFRLLLYLKERRNLSGERVLVYGADLEGAMALQDLFWNRSRRYQPVGFIDDDPNQLHRLVNGFAVLGDIQSLEAVVRAHSAHGLIVASQTISEAQMAVAAKACGRAGVWLKRFHVELHALPTGDLSEYPQTNSPVRSAALESRQTAVS